MKQLWPEKPSTLQTIGDTGRKVVYSDILDILEKIDALTTEVTLDKEELASYKEAMQEAIATGVVRTDTIHALKAFLSSIETSSILSDEATITQLQATTASLSSLEADEATITKITSPSAVIEDLTSRDIGAETITVTDLNATNLAVENYTVEHVVGDTGTFSTVTTDELEADAISTTDLEADVATIADLKTETAEIGELKSDAIDVTEVKHTTHNTIEGSEDIYIHVPVLTGRTLLLFKDEDKKIASIQILNTENNVTVMWSDFAKSPERYLIDSKFVEMGNYSILILHFKGLTADFEEYIYSDYNDEVLLDQVVYADDWHVPDTRVSDMEYIFGYRNGTKFFRNLDLDKDGGEVHALTGNFTDVYDDTDDDSFTYDTSETIEKLFYRPDQEVNTDSDVEHHNLHLTGALFDGTDVEDEDGNVIGFEGDEASLLFTDGETLEWKKGTDRQVLREKETNGVLALEYESPVDNTVYPTKIQETDGLITEHTLVNYNGEAFGYIAKHGSYWVKREMITPFFETVDSASDSIKASVPKNGGLYINNTLIDHIEHPQGSSSSVFFAYDASGKKIARLNYNNTQITFSPTGPKITDPPKAPGVYPISELRDGTTTHGNHTVETDLTVRGKITEDVYIGTHAFVGAHSDNSKLNVTDYSLVIEEEEDE